MSSVRRSFDLPAELAARLSQRAFEDMTTQRAIVERALEHELAVARSGAPVAVFDYGTLVQTADDLARGVMRRVDEPSAYKPSGANERVQGKARAADRLSRGLFRSTGLPEGEK